MENKETRVYFWIRKKGTRKNFVISVPVKFSELNSMIGGYPLMSETWFIRKKLTEAGYTNKQYTIGLYPTSKSDIAYYDNIKVVNI